MAESRWRYWRRFNLPNLIYLLILVAVMALSYWYVRKNTNESTAPNKQQTDRMDGFAEQVELTQTSENGSLLYHASMNDIEHFGNDDIKGNNVLLITTSEKQPRVTVKASQAIWHSKQQTVELTGSIEMIRETDAKDPDSRPMRLTTDSMNIDMAKGLASSDDAFTMQHGESILNGKRFRYDYQLRDLSMGGTDGERIKAKILNQ